MERPDISRQPDPSQSRQSVSCVLQRVAWTSLTLLCLCAAVLVNACSGGNPPVPPATGWVNFAKNAFTPLGHTFTIGTNPIPGYVTEPPLAPLLQGKTITLNYTINGNGPYTIVDPSDVPPASITLFIWEKGDTLSSTTPGYQYYRWWCPTRAVLVSGANQTLSCVIGGQWTNVVGQAANGADPNAPSGFAQALANAQGVGFTFGGGYFYGHGATDGSTTFTINNFTVQ